MFIRYTILLLLVIFADPPSFCSGAMIDMDKNSINSIRAIVDDEIITHEEVIKHAAVAIKEAQERYRENELMDKIEEILKDTLEEMINRKVLIKEANRLFSTNELMMKDVEKDLDSFVKGAVKKVGSLSKYYEIAESQGINPIEKRNALKEDIMIDKIMKENVYDRVKIQPKLLRRYYCENIDEFRQKKEVKLRHIMIRFSAHKGNKEETFSVAQQIMSRIKKGENFSALAQQYSEGPNAENGGLWSFEEVRELRKDLRDVVYSLKDNECSKIIESSVGYHIFKVELIKPEKTQAFEAVQDEIYKKIYREETTRLKNQYINSLKTGVFVQIID
ncbi:MAG: Survival protein SurA precursor (Peptidyl-prolyl cis-trans isomerase SurA) [Candidatus Jettenia ecosi]|uniref:peptidylprolyl isomerase n=1 Tax=Candidatus Jettenia ecosi TaxID=2494326 RepID=A0A533QA36_9BACT|nr:MAG: Survival protein SurA precursor (Peptidyl-prolyl cis-trans isomerase SurA) [Candidatus Jettenia ecosi]